MPAVFDIARGGHLLIAGAPQSGRSTVLRTLAGALAAQVDPDETHLYVLDGGGALSALTTLPHCGAVVTAAEPDRVERLLGRLTAELGARTRMLAVSGHGDLAEYRAAQPAGRRPPFLLVFVDRYDAFMTALEHIDGGRLLGELQRLIRDGLAAGIRVIVTGDRTLLTGRLGGLVEQKLVLRMADRTDFALAGLHSRAIPRDMPNGRGFLLPAGDLLQVASLSAQGAGADENRALRDLAGRAATGDQASVPGRPAAAGDLGDRGAPPARATALACWSGWAATSSARSGWRHKACWSSARRAPGGALRWPSRRPRLPGPGCRWCWSPRGVRPWRAGWTRCFSTWRPATRPRRTGSRALGGADGARDRGR